MALYPTNFKEVEEVISSLKLSSAVGSDNISSKILRNCRSLLSNPIAFLVNLSYEDGVFPDIFKTAIVCPIYKAGNKILPTNYRPISLLSSLSKILEKLTNKRLIQYIESNCYLSNHQYGFRVHRSTDDAVLNLTSKITSYIDRKEKCLGVFLDLQKAFDTVSIPILITRLENIGVRGNALLWFRDYLSNRNQRVRVQDNISDSLTNKCGIPQGSNLGPTLFLIYVNELNYVQMDNADIQMFADDTVILYHGKTWDEVHMAAEVGMSRISCWLEDSLLTLNTSKTKYLCFSKTVVSSPSDFSFKIHSYPCNRALVLDSDSCNCPLLERMSSIKYLGVYIDERLNWRKHVDYISGRLRKLIYVFKDLRIISNQSLLLQTYKALAECLISYCICSWGAAARSFLIVAERAQRAVLKVLLKLPYRHPTVQVYDQAKVLTVRQMFVYEAIKRFHKSVDPTPSISRRDNTGDAPRVHSAFAKHTYNFHAPRLYSMLNSIHKVRSLSNYNLKVKVKEWLNNQNYKETEDLLDILV